MRYDELNLELWKTSKSFLQEHTSFFHPHSIVFYQSWKNWLVRGYNCHFQFLIGPLCSQERDSSKEIPWDKFGLWEVTQKFVWSQHYTHTKGISHRAEMRRARIKGAMHLLKFLCKLSNFMKTLQTFSTWSLNLLASK